MFRNINNVIANSFLEATLPRGFRKPQTGSSSDEVKRFLREKYIDMKYAASGTEPAELFYQDKKKYLKKIGKLMKSKEEESEDSGEDEREAEK